MFARVKKLWKRIVKRSTTTTGIGTSWWRAFVGNRAASGVEVTEQNTLGNSTVLRAVNILTGIIAAMPFEVYERDADGNTRIAHEHPLSYLLGTQPSKLYSSFKFRQQLIFNLLLCGNGIAHIRRTPNAEPFSIRVIQPNSAGCVVDEQAEEIYYHIHGEGIVDGDDVIHISGIGADGVTGYNPIFLMKDELGLNISTREAKSMAYANGAHPSGVLEHEGKPLSDDAYKRLKSSFQQSYGGIENMGSTVVLEGGVKFKPVGYTLNDLAMADVDAMNVANVARWLGVPLHLLEALQKATLNNVHSLTLQFVKFTIGPLVRQIEQEFDRKVFRQDERGRMFTRFDLKTIERGDAKLQAEFIQSMIMSGAYSINDARRFLDLDPVEGGDVHRVQAQNVDIANTNTATNDTSSQATNDTDTTEPATANAA